MILWRNAAIGLFALSVISSFCESISNAEITFQGEKKVPAYSIAKVRAMSDEYKSYIYKVYGPDGKKVKTEKGESGWVLFTGPPGTYRVEAVAGRVDKEGGLILDEAETTITIGGNGPQPGPSPGPEPSPGPSTPLAKTLKAAFDKETDASRGTHIRNLATIYATASNEVKMGKPKTMGQLWKMMEAGAEVAKLDGKVPLVQAEIAKHCKRLPSKSGDVINDSNRETIAHTLGEVASALREVQP